MSANVATTATEALTKSISSFTLSLSGATSGQPIILLLPNLNNASAISPTISDTFSTPYTWTKIDSGSETLGNEMEAWIGTGGVGTSGVITVSGLTNSSSDYWGGMALALSGASTASGLAAIESHGNITNPSSSTTATGPSLTPANGTELAVYIMGTWYPISGAPSSPWTSSYMAEGSTNYVGISYQSAPASGVALAPTWTQSGSSQYCAVGVLVLAGTTPVAISSTIASNSTVVASVTTPAKIASTVASNSSVVASVTVSVSISATAASNSTVSVSVSTAPSISSTIASNSSVTVAVKTSPAVSAVISSGSSVVASVATPGLISSTIASNSTVTASVGVESSASITGLVISSSSGVAVAVSVPAPSPPASSPSPRFLATALASDQTAFTLVQVWTQPSATAAAAFLEDITSYCTAAGLTWTETEGQSPRRTGALTLESQGLLVDGLIPKQIGDLLHPLSGNEIRIYQGYSWPDGTTETVPCGVYRISKPTTTDDDTKAEISITLNDRAAEISRRSWTAPYVITGAPTIDQAILAGMSSIWPGLTYNLEPSTYTVPDITFGTQGMSGPQDPMADFIGLATANGQELFFDDNGVVTLRTIPDPGTVVVSLRFAEGETCTVTEAVEEQDETEAFNTVVVTSSAPGVAYPVQEVVSITDPDNPFNPDNYGAVVPYFYTTPLVTSADQAIAAGVALLQSLMSAYDLVSFNAVMNASLKCGQGVQLIRGRLGINATFCVTSAQFSSDPSQAMQITLRSRVSPDGS